MTTFVRYGVHSLHPFVMIRAFQHIEKSLKWSTVNQLICFIDSIEFVFETFAFFYTAESCTVQNELLKPQIIGETNELADRNGKSNFTVVKHIVFTMIWAFVAWHLLTVKEKNLPKYDVVANFNQTKSKHLTFK